MEVFISYRRKDSHYIADRIYDGLVLEFGRDSIFKDVDAIPLGRDFRRILQEAVTRCDVLLAVIGPRWLGETDAMGRRRVDDPEDWVRIEIETALERAIPVIPLLVDGASFPRGDDLPPSLQGLVYRHGTSVRPDPDFHHDMGRVIKALREIEPVVSSNQSQVRGREPSRSKNPATESVLPHSRSDRTSYSHLLRWALLFAIIALVAGFFGFYGVQGISAQIAKICFFVFLVLFVVSLIMGRRVVEGPPL